MKKYIFGCIIAISLSACSRVNENNIVESYEWFKATTSAVDAKVAMIKNHNAIVQASVGEAKDKAMLELAGLKQSCIDLIGQYNGKAAMITRGGLALPSGMPAELSMSICQ